MRRTVIICGLSLFVWLAATSAFAGPPGLEGTKWFGPITIVVASSDELVSDNATIEFKTDTGEFIVGTLAFEDSGVTVPFGGLRDGRSVKMTGVNYLMAGEIFKGRWHKKGKHPTQTMMIQGSGLAEGLMFEGVLTQVTTE